MPRINELIAIKILCKKTKTPLTTENTEYTEKETINLFSVHSGLRGEN